jgi:hypothetical protein
MAMLAFADDAALARLVIAAALRRATSTESKLSYRAVERGHASAGLERSLDA